MEVNGRTFRGRGPVNRPETRLQRVSFPVTHLSKSPHWELMTSLVKHRFGGSGSHLSDPSIRGLCSRDNRCPCLPHHSRSLSHSSHFSNVGDPDLLTFGQSPTPTNFQGIPGGLNRNVIKYGSVHKTSTCTSASHLESSNNCRGTASDTLPHSQHTAKKSDRYGPTSALEATLPMRFGMLGSFRIHENVYISCYCRVAALSGEL